MFFLQLATVMASYRCVRSGEVWICRVPFIQSGWTIIAVSVPIVFARIGSSDDSLRGTISWPTGSSDSLIVAYSHQLHKLIQSTNIMDVCKSLGVSNLSGPIGSVSLHNAFHPMRRYGIDYILHTYISMHQHTFIIIILLSMYIHQ
jgi:hypothetical protein